MGNDLFRKSVLDKISSPDKLNEYIKITNPGAWAVAIGCIAALAAIMIWLLLGSVPDTVSAQGILFPSGGVIAVTAPAGGKITDMRVEAGSDVRPHDIIAVVPQPDILAEIETLKKAPNPDENAIWQKISEFQNMSVIRSQVYGTVLSAKHLNEMAEANETLASVAVIDVQTNNYAVIAYVDMNTAQRLKTGMEVQISPSFAPREEYGYMMGHIAEVGAYPVSTEDIRASVGGGQYIANIPAGEKFVEVQVDIVLDTDSSSAENTAKWSNAAGNSLPLGIGTECDLLIVLKEQKPYELVF